MLEFLVLQTDANSGARCFENSFSSHLIKIQRLYLVISVLDYEQSLFSLYRNSGGNYTNRRVSAKSSVDF